MLQKHFGIKSVTFVLFYDIFQTIFLFSAPVFSTEEDDTETETKTDGKFFSSVIFLDLFNP